MICSVLKMNHHVHHDADRLMSLREGDTQNRNGLVMKLCRRRNLIRQGTWCAQQPNQKNHRERLRCWASRPHHDFTSHALHVVSAGVYAEISPLSNRGFMRRALPGRLLRKPGLFSTCVDGLLPALLHSRDVRLLFSRPPHTLRHHRKPYPPTQPDDDPINPRPFLLRHVRSRGRQCRHQ